MSTALYRRYRPDTFDQVIGQEHVTKPLMAALRAQKVTHAYLFSGPRGCGKTTSARILARCLNCAQYPTDTPCGQCDSCRELATGGPGSLDVVEIDAASHNGVDDARELRERAAFAPVRDRFKIFILDEAHMVTSAGFNALLKLVEEPPEHVKFIFATTEPEKVISTIRSRTHHYPFRLVPPEIMRGFLADMCAKEGISPEGGVLNLVMRAGGGSVRDTLGVLDQLMAGCDTEVLSYEMAVHLLGYTDSTLLAQTVDAIAGRDGAGAFRIVERIIESGHDPRRFVEDLLQRLRDLLVISVSNGGAIEALQGIPQDELDQMLTQAKVMGAADLSRAADLTNEALTAMSGAISPRLQLELLIAKLLLPAQTVAVAPSAATAVANPDLPDSPAAIRQMLSKRRGGANQSAATSRASQPESSAATRGEAAAPAQSEKPLQQVAQPNLQAPAEEAGEPQQAQKASPEPAGRQDSQSEPEKPQPSQEATMQVHARPESVKSERPRSVEAPPAQKVPDSPAPANQPSASSDGTTSETIRNRWQEVTEFLAQNHARSTWGRLTQAQLGTVTDGQLTIRYQSPGMAQAFNSGTHTQVLSNALYQVLGVKLQVVALSADDPNPTPAQRRQPAQGSKQGSAEKNQNQHVNAVHRQNGGSQPQAAAQVPEEPADDSEDDSWGPIAQPANSVPDPQEDQPGWPQVAEPPVAPQEPGWADADSSPAADADDGWGPIATPPSPPQETPSNVTPLHKINAQHPAGRSEEFGQPTPPVAQFDPDPIPTHQGAREIIEETLARGAQPEAPVQNVDDNVSPDDPEAEDTGVVGLAAVEDILGARIISDTKE